MSRPFGDNQNEFRAGMLPHSRFLHNIGEKHFLLGVPRRLLALQVCGSNDCLRWVSIHPQPLLLVVHGFLQVCIHRFLDSTGLAYDGRGLQDQ